MTTAGSFDAPIEIFGGLVTDMSPADLPHGVSPDCQDVIFSNGNVATRPGLQALFGPLAGNPTVNYVDRKSTRLNSSHPSISYAVFCLKKKKINTKNKHIIIT